MKKLLVLVLVLCFVLAMTACATPAPATSSPAASSSAPASSSVAASSSVPASSSESVSTSSSASTSASSASASASGSTIDTKGLKIGYLINSTSDSFQGYALNGAKKRAQELGINLVVNDAQEDASKQMAQLDAMITEGGYKAIIVVACDTSGGEGPELRAKADKAGIPLIGVVRYFKEAWASVSTDPKQAGQMQAQLVEKVLNNKGNVGILLGQLGSVDEVNRTAALKEELAKYPDIKVVREETGNWDRAQAMKVAENWIQSGQKIDCIAANCDEMGVGAALAYSAAGKTSETQIVGIDGNITGLEAIKEGIMQGTTFQPAAGQGATAVDTAVSVIKGEIKDGTWVQINFELVTKDNLQKYVDIWAAQGVQLEELKK